MDECPLMATFAFFLNLYKSHLFQNLIEKHVVNFIWACNRNAKFFEDSIILFNEFLSNILLIIHIKASSTNHITSL